LIDDDYGIAFELSMFITNIKKEVFGILECFFFFQITEKEHFTTCYV